MKNNEGNGHESVALGGRPFTLLARPTLEGERHWFWALKRGGLESLQRRSLESQDDFRARVRTHVLDSGVACRLMAMLLVPAGELWCPASAGVVAPVRDGATAILLHAAQTDGDLAVQRRVLERVLDTLVQRYEEAGVRP